MHVVASIFYLFKSNTSPYISIVNVCHLLEFTLVSCLYCVTESTLKATYAINILRNMTSEEKYCFMGDFLVYFIAQCVSATICETKHQFHLHNNYDW